MWWLPECIDDIIIDGDGEADMCTRSSSSATSASSRLRREPYKPYDEEVVVVVVVGEADGDGEGDGEGTKIGCKTVRSCFIHNGRASTLQLQRTVQITNRQMIFFAIDILLCCNLRAVCAPFVNSN